MQSCIALAHSGIAVSLGCCPVTQRVRCVSRACISLTNAVDKDDDVDRPNPRAGILSARHVSQVAQVREMSQHVQVAQRRADPSSGEIAPSTYLKTRVASLSLTATSSLCSLCVSDCHALYVLALHGVVPRLAVHFHASLSEECLHHDLHVFSGSSRNTCSSRSREGIGSMATRCSVRFS